MHARTRTHTHTHTHTDTDTCTASHSLKNYKNYYLKEYVFLMSFLMFIYIYKFTKCITKVVIEQLATSSKMNGSLLPLLVKTIYFLNCNPVRFISNQQMAHLYT